MAYRPGRKKVKYKVVVMGDQYCGKTSIIERYIRGTFPSAYIQTQAGEYYTKEVSAEGKSFHLSVFDTAGQETLKTIIRNMYRNAHGILLVFDFSRADTLQHIKDWVHLIKTNCDILPEMVLVGNKTDLEDSKRQVSSEQGHEEAAHHGLKFFEVSAKKNVNVTEAFDALARQILECRGWVGDAARLNGSFRLGEEKKPESKSCC